MTLDQLRQSITGTLRRQLTFGMVLIVVSMMTVFVWDLVARQRAEAIEQQSERAVAVAQSVASSSALWVVAKDFSGLQEIVQGLSSYPDMGYAIVLDTQGEVLAHTDPSKRGLYLGDLPGAYETTVLQRGVDVVDVALPILLDTRPVGWVRVGMTGTLLEQRLDHMRQTGTYYTLIAIALVTVFAIFASGYMTRRLHAIAHVAGVVRSGDESLRVQVRGTDEAALLAAQFNAMLDSLAQRSVALKDSEAFKNAILDSVAAEVAVIDRDGAILAVNAHWRQFALENSKEPVGTASGSDVGTNYLAVCSASAQTGSLEALDVRGGIEAVLTGSLPSFSMDYACHAPHQLRYFSMVVRPLGAGGHGGAVITHTDITSVKRTEHYEQFRSHILELLAKDVALAQLLDAIVRGVEAMHPSALCSVLMLSGDGRHLGNGVAPSLPAFFSAAIEGMEVGMGVGSCGTAAVTGQRVVVSDIATHPYWVNYRTVAQNAGLRACWAQPITSSTGKVLGTFAIYHRTTRAPVDYDMVLIEQSARLVGIAIEHKATQAALQASEVTFRNLFETTPHGVVYQDATGRITSANSAALRILGVAFDEIKGQTSMHADWRMIRQDGCPVPDELHPTMRALQTGQPVIDELVQFSRPGGRFAWLLITAMPVFRDGKLEQVYAIFEDVTERHLMQEQIRQLAFFDPLTQLPNRRLLTDRLSQALAANKRANSLGAMLFLDLDNFKPLNDSHGHDVGDLLLMEVARRLKNCVREADTVARFGGDEFVVMLTDLGADFARAEIEASSIAEKIRIQLQKPYVLHVHKAQKNFTVEHHCTASMGLSLFDSCDTDQEVILQRADAAMYLAKERGRNCVAITPVPASAATVSPARRLPE